MIALNLNFITIFDEFAELRKNSKKVLEANLCNIVYELYALKMIFTNNKILGTSKRIFASFLLNDFFVILTLLKVAQKLSVVVDIAKAQMTI